MKRKIQAPKKSLRTLLMMCLILFSVVPLAFITGYSLVKYEQAIDQELFQRLSGNRREVEVILQEFRSEMFEKTKRHSVDSALVVFLTSRNINQVRERASQLMRSHFSTQMQIFDRDGLAQVSLFKTGDQEIQRRQSEEQRVQLTEAFLKKLSDRDSLMTVDLVSDKKMDLISFSKIKAPNGSLVGYIEEFVTLDTTFLNSIKNRLNIELIVFDKHEDGAKKRAIATHPDLKELETKQSYFTNQSNQIGSDLFELTIREVPYGFSVQKVDWGDAQIYLAIGASKQAIKAVLSNVNYAFFWVVGTIVVLLVLLSLLMSRILLRPLNNLLLAIEKVDADGSIPEVANTSDNELGLLIESFNEMSLKVKNAQRALKGKISELEEVNEEKKDTQARLVHSAKMVSLGQLVAGIAHELNNPISFIYSNVSHLRDYGQKLIHLVNIASKNPSELEAEKEKAEFEYIIKDLPKLIQSCEEGARRTRDIVLGLRNFSRLDEAKIKEVDIHDGIDSTIDLLAGEMRPRIQVKKIYGRLPKVTCYPSQLNQVFMNIITNAIHAIKDRGEIIITTKQPDDEHVQISIRDTGVGMSKDVQEKLFDPFFTTKGINQGTGLGMSITYGIIEKHGGEITVKSKLGQGTEFVINLPLRSA